MGEYTKEEIEKMIGKAKKGIYYNDDDLKNNNNSIKGLKKYDFEGKEIK